ncbi:Putative uncharacterized protein OS=Rhodopirellula baltica (strain SH1) GN=RB459 PE=4 SV=1: DUF4276 [Gemmataceae bacterium]|nr:Putative uncharacterized protein OS=Rhodopirellula baltica (strain SH1) GN=RB459 PE=4 SV=1: DUF4276 [Gemmataceae bacterium]VTU02284.1 Putative uncharacterized protein OS=Rhodopirellula baltica (strain SH1) GN=RB459 PE=4 SV=1: DUF4276 [Gemmataceae bacterium]
MSRLVLCVEGDGDVEAAPVLVSRLWLELPPELQAGFVDTNPLRVGGLSHLMGRRAPDWPRFLRAASLRPNCSGVLLLLDADTLEDDGGCVVETARALAEAARAAGGGTLFSVGVVFFRKEFESLLIASYPFLPGRREGVTLPANVEEGPRGAKGWLKRNLDGGYKEAQDQITLTRAMNFDRLRELRIKSFLRLEHAVRELAEAMASVRHIVSPLPPTPEATGN